MSGLRDLHLGRGLVVPRRCLSQRFSRAGGAGGQNVNKVETRVDVRVDLDRATAALGPVRSARLRARLARRLDAEGRVQVVCDEHRERGRNLTAALARLEALLTAALVEPRPRRPTRPTRASGERRLAAKKRRARVKRERGRDEDE